MKRSSKLIIFTGILILLVLIFILISNASKKKEEASSEKLFDIKAEDIVSLSWNMGGEDISLAKTGGEWKLAGEDDFPLDRNAAEKLSERIAGLSASRRIETGEAAEYGIVPGGREVTARTESAEYRVSVGNENPLSPEIYISIGDGFIYTVPSSFTDGFSKSVSELIENEPIEIPSDASLIRIKSENGEFTAKKDPSDNWASDGTTLDKDSMLSLLSQISSLRQIECVSYGTNDEKMKEFGLAPPQGEIYIDGENEDITLLFGKRNDEGNIYFALGGSDMVYTTEPGISSVFGITAEKIKAE